MRIIFNARLLLLPGKGILDVQPSAPGEAAREKILLFFPRNFKGMLFIRYRGEITRAFSPEHFNI